VIAFFICERKKRKKIILFLFFRFRKSPTATRSTRPMPFLYNFCAFLQFGDILHDLTFCNKVLSFNGQIWLPFDIIKKHNSRTMGEKSFLYNYFAMWIQLDRPPGMFEPDLIISGFKSRFYYRKSGFCASEHSQTLFFWLVTGSWAGGDAKSWNSVQSEPGLFWYSSCNVQL
jgi:hypothetical protein